MNGIRPDNANEIARKRQDAQQALRRDQISEDSMVALLDGINQIEQDDPAMADALREIGHILTGDDRFARKK